MLAKHGAQRQLELREVHVDPCDQLSCNQLRRAQGELKIHLLNYQSLLKSEKESSPFGRETWSCYRAVGAFLEEDG